MNKNNQIIILFFLNIFLLILIINDLIKNNKIVNKYLTTINNNVHIDNIEDNTNKEEDIQMNNELLSLKEISNYNQIIMSKTNELYDLDNYNKFKKETILKYILKYTIPKNKYNNGRLITNIEIEEILNNRNINNINDINNIQKAIIIKRTNLRSFPTNTNFYDTKVNDYDRLQETELLVNTGIIILHESKDKLWNFVMSPIYIGWVEKENIALANDEDYNFFINNSNFGIIIDKYIEIDDIILDMSVKLPYLNDKFIMPVKNNDGYVGRKEVLVASDKINIGYLPYTKGNVINEALKYKGVSYSWGGYNKNVDCSSFVMNVYKTFGFIFPRNTSSQNKSVGKIISLLNKAENEKIKLINGTEPSLLYQDGHVMLYIGDKDNEHYIIHASGEGSVKVSVLENSNYLKKINKLVLVGK